MYAIGISKEVLLVQHPQVAAHEALDGSSDVRTMFLVHRSHFNPKLHHVVLRDEKSTADLIAYFFTAERVRDEYRAFIGSRLRKLIDNNLPIRLFVV